MNRFKNKIFNQKDRILVTGGSGFIGVNLISYILKHTNNSVLNIDKLTYASNKNFLTRKNSNYSFEKIDLCNFKKINDAIFKFKPHKIIHLAAESHVDRSIEKRDDFIKSNYFGTFSLLEASLSYWKQIDDDLKKSFVLLNASTDEVYGDASNLKKSISENSSFKPSSPYSASKVGGESLVYSYYKTFGLPVVITRSSNNFGPFQNKEKFIPSIIFSILKNKKIKIYGDGKQIRDWIYVDDNIEGILTVAFCGKLGEAYNLGGNNLLKNIEIVEKISNYIKLKTFKVDRKKFNFLKLINNVPDRLGHDKKYSIDSSKIANQLNWKAKSNFEKALKETIAWYTLKNNK